ncbi:MAG: PAS domain S-box protein [Leptolyngbyaceae bacterium]|nr:PAS domain S-box protein [Leptolyngbyaceae bacterium]
MKILVVEDEAILVQALQALLTDHHYSVDIASDGLEGLAMSEAYTYDLILLDIGLPKLDGVSLCQQLRSKGIQTPILLLTGQVAEANAKADALNAGADDYVTKPFDVEELLARIQSLLRRGGLKAPPILKWGNLTLDPSHLQVNYGEALLYLTPKEYGLLEVLVRHAPSILNAAAILDKGWSALESPGEETVRTHLKDLRKKLKAAGAPEDFIKTVHRQGYRLNPVYGEAAFTAQEGDSTAMLRMAELKAVNEQLRKTLEQLQATQAELQQKNQVLEQVQQTLTAERQQLQIARDELSRRVEARTEALSAANAARQHQHLQRQALFDHALEAILIADDDGRYIDANPAACELLGMPHADVLQHSVADFADPAMDAAEVWRQFLEQGRMSGEFRLYLPDGQVKDAEFNAIAHFIPGQHLSVMRDIRDRKQLELSLQSSEAKLSQIINSAIAAIASFRLSRNKEWIYDYFSAGFEAVFGYTAQELMADQQLWWSRVWPDDRETVLVPVIDDLFAERDVTVEFRFCHKDGSVRWIRASHTSHQINDDFWLVTVVNSDISDRKQAELDLQRQIRQEHLLTDIAQEIRQSLELNQVLSRTVDRVRELLNCDRVFIFRFRPTWQGDVIMESVSDQWVSILSTTIFDPCFEDRLIESYRQGHVSILNDINRPGLEPCYVELLQHFQVKASLAAPILQGNHLWGLLIAHQCTAPRQWEPTEVNLLQRLAIQVGIASQQSELYEQTRNELSARQQMQAVLEESEARFRSLGAAAPIGICQTNADGTCLYVNPRWCEISGLSFEDCLGDGWLQGIHPDDRTMLATAWDSYLGGRTDSLPEFRLLNSQGDIRWISAKIAAIQSAAGDIIGYVSTDEDITERKQAEQALRDSEQRLQAILDYSPSVIYLMDCQNTYLLVNRSYADKFSTTPEELVGKTLYEIWPAETATEFATQNRTVFETGQLLQLEENLPLPDGIYSYLTVKFPLHDGEGNPYAICGISTDITEQKKLEAQFYQAQRLESLGTLASGIAHDLNNILTPILTMAQLLRLTGEGLDAKGLKRLQFIEASAKRGADLVKQILLVTRASQGEQTAVDLAELLQDEIEIIQQSFPQSIRIRVDVPSSQDTQPALGAILADPTYLRQIILNLCINARDAMPTGGTLTISAEKVFVDKFLATQNLDAQVGNYAAITVADTGLGIPPHVQERMFDPFFTTKAPGQGTGLGLATVRGLVKANQGFVQVFSEVGQGAEFKVYFPLVEGDVAGSSLPQPVSVVSPENHEALVLVVEDESIVRNMLRSLLETQHYRTLLAQDGAEALEQYRQYPSEIQLVVTDLMMPVMDGFTLIKHLKALKSDVPIIALSGVPTQENLALAAGANCFLSKPFSMNALLSLISALLNSAQITED